VKEQEIKAFPEPFKSSTLTAKKLVSFIEEIPQSAIALLEMTIASISV